MQENLFDPIASMPELDRFGCELVWKSQARQLGATQHGIGLQRSAASVNLPEERGKEERNEMLTASTQELYQKKAQTEAENEILKQKIKTEIQRQKLQELDQRCLQSIMDLQALQ